MNSYPLLFMNIFLILFIVFIPNSGEDQDFSNEEDDIHDDEQFHQGEGEDEVSSTSEEAGDDDTSSTPVKTNVNEDVPSQEKSDGIEFVTDYEDDQNEIEVLTALDNDLLMENCDCGQESVLKAPSVKDRRRRKRIVSDRATWPFHRYPWIAQIRVDDVHICGAAVINPNYLITAAHCAINLASTDDYKHTGEISIKEGRVALGSQVKDQQFVTYKIIKYVLHPLYKNNEDRPIYDIALLKVQNPIMFSSRIRPICLPASRVLETPGVVAKAVGWGITQEGTEPSPVLKEVILPIVTNKECNETISEPYRNRIGNFSICAGGEEGRDTCQADSGGPLQALNSNGRWTLVGITSWSDNMHCGLKGQPGVYARVSYFIHWILNETRDSIACKTMDYHRIEPNLVECGLKTWKYEVEEGDDSDGDEFKGLRADMIHPWMVQILYNKVLIGTGVLVNRSTVLTTTDVIDPWDSSYRAQNLTVHFGSMTGNASEHHFLALVKHIMFHPMANFKFDICLLRLKLKLAENTAYYSTICFPHMKLFKNLNDKIDGAVYTKGGHDSALKIFNSTMLATKHCTENRFRHHHKGLICAYIEHSGNQTCPAIKSLALTEVAGQRTYLIGMARSLKRNPCVVVANDINYIWDWISQSVTLLDMI